MIFICGDTVPTKSNTQLFTYPQMDKLLGKDLYTLLKNSEGVILNIETPLTDREDPIIKCGPCLSAETNVVNGLKDINVRLVTLANNHIMDQNIYGLKSTCDVLDKNEIEYVGVGQSLENAKKPCIFQYNNKDIGIYACTEHEFSTAEEDYPGANPFDPLESYDHIVDLKKEVEYLIVLYHGGKEHYRYPSPMLQKICRKFIDKGANLVICQHSHCIGCQENYMGGNIIYGQGNFVFDRNDSDYWKTGLIIGLDNEFQLYFYPIVKKGETVRLAADKDKDNIMSQFQKRSISILKNGFVEQTYNDFAEEALEWYISCLSNHNPSLLYRVINKISNYRLDKIRKKKYLTKQGVVVRNYIECEAHRELLLRGLMRNEK